MSPCSTLTAEDLAARRFADGDVALRVSAMIWKSSLAFRRASTTAPPWLPVAPVTRMTLDIFDQDLSGCCLDLNVQSCGG